MGGPDSFGRFQIESVIGRGGMGVVYRAVDPVLDRAVAIKAIDIHPGLDADVVSEMERRFENEARAAARLSHPNLVTIYDAGRQGDTLYIAMELVDGEGLDDILAAGRVLSYKEVADLTLQLAAALDAAHGQGIVHRDIKPANILLERGGRPRIADFGVARQATSNLTATGTIIGTPAYMSPEQITGHEVTGAADQFSLAVVVYELLTRHKPFEGEGATTVLYKIVHEEPRRPVELEARLPAAVDAALMRALEKAPESRYRTCSEFASRVREVLGAAPPDDVLSLTAGIGTEVAGGSAEAPDREVSVPGPDDSTRLSLDREPRDPAPGAEEPQRSSKVPGVAVAVAAGAAVVLLVVAWLLLGGGVAEDAALATRSDGPAEGVAGSAGEDAAASVPGAAVGPGADGLPVTRAAYRIETRPADSRVTVDGVALEGSSPYEVELAPDDVHTIRVERSGHEPVGWRFSLADLTEAQRESRTLFFPLVATDALAAGTGEETGAVTVPEELLPPVDPVRIRGRIEAPEVLERTEPPYPEWARQQGLPVYVVLELVIDEEGRVRDARPLGRDVHPSLVDLAATAVRRWRFAPARRQEGGEPVAVYFNVSVQFDAASDGNS